MKVEISYLSDYLARLSREMQRDSGLDKTYSLLSDVIEEMKRSPHHVILTQIEEVLSSLEDEYIRRGLCRKCGEFLPSDLICRNCSYDFGEERYLSKIGIKRANTRLKEEGVT